jgi:hypothetical protein
VVTKVTPLGVAAAPSAGGGCVQYRWVVATVETASPSLQELLAELTGFARHRLAHAPGDSIEVPTELLRAIVRAHTELAEDTLDGYFAAMVAERLDELNESPDGLEVTSWEEVRAELLADQAEADA